VPWSIQSARLRRIVGGYAINRLGTWFGLIALLIAVFDHTHSAIAVAALLFAGQALPAFVVPAVVARVEASTRRRELSALYLFEAATTAALAVLLLWSFWLPGVLLLVALDGTAALVASALLRTATVRAAREQAEADRDGQAPVSDGPEEAVQMAERKANAALNVAFSATFLLGPALAGVVVAAAGAPASLFIDAGSFLICGALLTDLHPHVEEAGGNSVRARLRKAWKHINVTPALRWLLLVYGLAFVFFECAGPIEVTYVKATLHAGDRGLGLLLTSWGVGAVLGSLLFARLVSRALGAMLSAGALLVGLAYLGFAAAPSLGLACIAAVVGGVGNGIELPAAISMVQRLTPIELHGRLMGAVESLTALCLAVGIPLGGALVALSSPRAAFVVAGLGTVATSAALVRVSLRRGEQPAPADELVPMTGNAAGILHEPVAPELERSS
jgi:MFS family permease